MKRERMPLAEFDRRAKALGQDSELLPYAKRVLVGGESHYRAAADACCERSTLWRLCRRISTLELCPCCGLAVGRPRRVNTSIKSLPHKLRGKPLVR